MTRFLVLLSSVCATLAAVAQQPDRWERRPHLAGTPEHAEQRVYKTTTQYVAKAREWGVQTELWLGKGQSHGFFHDSPWLEVSTDRMDRFLTRLGYLEGEPTVKLPADAPSLEPDQTQQP